MAELVLTDAGRIELDELSALCVREDSGGGHEVLAVGDGSFQIARLARDPPAHLGLSADLRAAVEDQSHEPEKGSQWEGVAADGTGSVFVLQEHAGKEEPSHVFVFAPGLDSLVASIALHVDEGDARWRRKWRKEPNERGEGLLLLRDGHLLVVKQKDPTRLIEFGPDGAEARGLGPERLLGPGERFDLAGAATADYRALDSWDVGDDLESLNDVAVADDRLYVLSRSSRRLARLGAPILPGTDTAEIEDSWALPAEIECPEGLVILGGSTLLVADDQAPEHAKPDNVFRLAWPAGAAHG